MTVVFFISGHGFGHASRQVEIIRALAAVGPDLRILLRTAVSPSLLDRTLGVPYELRPGACDAGIVQSSSIAHDDVATIREAISFYSQFEMRIEAEVRALGGDDVFAIVGDIPPIAFEVADRLGVPGIAISNFTWDWIFETHPGMATAAAWLVPRLRQAYRLATHALELPFSGGFEVFSKAKPLPLVARRATRDRAETRRHFEIDHDRPALLLSFGGYGLPDLDFGRLNVFGEWTIITTDRTSREASAPEGVRFLSEAKFVASGFRYEDLIAAVDVVVTKPGYGIVAECISTRTAMLYTSRGEFREYDVFVREMPRFLRCQFIDQADLFGGRWREPLSRLMAQPEPPERMRTDGAEVAAEEITAALDASRSGRRRGEDS